MLVRDRASCLRAMLSSSVETVSFNCKPEKGRNFRLGTNVHLNRNCLLTLLSGLVTSEAIFHIYLFSLSCASPAAGTQKLRRQWEQL